MNTYPVYVEARGRRVAAVVTVPDTPPRGVVIALASIGRVNMIGGTLPAHLSRRLVDSGYACVRLDYAGIGDSPGVVETWTPSEIEEAVAQASAVLRTTLEAVDVDRFVAVGTCYGGRVALQLVAEPECVGAVCLGLPVLEHGSLARMTRRVGARGRLARARSLAGVRKVFRRAARPQKPAAGVVSALEYLDRAPVVLLYGKDPASDHYGPRAASVLDDAVASLPSGRREQLELRVLAAGPLTTFDILSPGDQQSVVDTVVTYVTSQFDRGGAGDRPDSVPHVAHAQHA